MEDKIKVLISEEELTKRCKEIAEEISKEYEDKTPILICPLKGAVNFFSKICENILKKNKVNLKR